jgi:hypothetical protein
MQPTPWTRTQEDNFWSRRYELVTLAEEACERAIEEQLQRWLRELEQTEGPAPESKD